MKTNKRTINSNTTTSINNRNGNTIFCFNGRGSIVDVGLYN